jgi:hypothetical protein
MKRSSILVFEDKYIIHSWTEHITGMLYAKHSDIIYIELPKTTSDSELAAAIKKTLYAFNPNVDSYGDIKENSKNHLKELGVKSFKELHLKAKNVDVDLDNDILTFNSTKNSGHKGGYEPLSIEPIKLSIGSDDTSIANAFKEAISKCL